MTAPTVTRTHKLFINGRFVRSESGATIAVRGPDGDARMCRASRKDLRDAVDAARSAVTAWSGMTAYLRGQVLYRVAELLDGRQDELVEALATGTSGRSPRDAARREVEASMDRLVCFAGWADKYAHILGGANPVADPCFTFTVPEPRGVVAVLGPEKPALLGLVSLVAAPLCCGNTVVALAGGRSPVPATVLAEACCTSDVPAGAVNVLTGRRADLVEHVAGHRDIDAVSAANVAATDASLLRSGTATNLKRVHIVRHTARGWQDPDRCESPWTIEPFVNMKTVWLTARDGC